MKRRNRVNKFSMNAKVPLLLRALPFFAPWGYTVQFKSNTSFELNLELKISNAVSIVDLVHLQASNQKKRFV